MIHYLYLQCYTMEKQIKRQEEQINRLNTVVGVLLDMMTDDTLHDKLKTMLKETEQPITVEAIVEARNDSTNWLGLFFKHWGDMNPTPIGGRDDQSEEQANG